ncbi:MAG: excinuclease ABC subunit UvrA [Ignavibacteriales bacterium]|nr:excinuclease ABC subunit UvrA [Ignavibacteriales bacterium]
MSKTQKDNINIADHLVVRGARVHNLKNIDVEIPRNAMTVITGLSGSGKSSLAFDTIYAEGQRRYVESLSAYARQFLEMMERPDVDYIEGLSPSISIEQKTVSSNPRSTVGTVTEIYDYLRLLFARVGTQFCYNCGRKVQRQSVDQIIDSIMSYAKGSKLQILAPVIKGRKGHYRELFEQILKDGFIRVRIDGEVKQIEKGLKADRYKLHNIEIVIDRISVEDKVRTRIADSVEVALKFGEGVLIVNDGKNDQLFSQKYSCTYCGISYEEPAPNSFSFNSPAGHCPKCEGLGELKAFDLSLIMPDESRSINQEGIAALGKPRPTWMFSQVKALGKKMGFDFDTPIKKFSPKAKEALLNGTGGEKLEIEYVYDSGRTVTYKHRFDGLMKMLKRYYDETSSNQIREWVEAFMTTSRCEVCSGGRLRKESLAIKVEDAKTGVQSNISDVVKMSVDKSLKFFEALTLTERQTEIAHQVLKEIKQRLSFLMNVGLNYLSLDRPARTLAGGEGQRIRLATQIGTQLVGVLYILDEPSIGLHQRDNIKLIDSLKSLRDLGNTIIVVEHDKEMILSADYVLDLGPGAGEHGGHVVTTGEPGSLAIKSSDRPLTSDIRPLKTNGDNWDGQSLTALYLKGKRVIERNYLVLKGASGNNLKNITLRLPLGTFICVTGVSGSGKSTLINETLFPILSRLFYKTKRIPLPYKSVDGLGHIDKVIDIDQSPIGRTPRSNPATYTGLFMLIRDLFTQLPEAQIRGYKAGRFSFNVKGGRCENCEGDGVKRIEMNFLPDVYVLCDVCNGKRYNRETLEVHYKGKSIAEVLGMTVDDAMELFSELPRIMRHLQTLHDVGLGYIRLGQQATTLSGGEAQRVKLSTELSKIGTGKTLYILDEPTTGLHFEDIRMLLLVLNKLVDKGNTVIVIEHNLDVIKTADWIVDLGPEGGDAGGFVVAEGAPEDVAKKKGSFTGEFLKRELIS